MTSESTISRVSGLWASARRGAFLELVMHAEHGAWPPPSSAYSFGLVFVHIHPPPCRLCKNHSILSIILNSTLGTRHLRLDPAAQLCLSLFLDLTPRGSSQHQVKFLSQGKWGRRINLLHKEVWSYLGYGNLLPYLSARLKCRKLILSLIKLKRMNVLAGFHHIGPVLFLAR